jgi:integrase
MRLTEGAVLLTWAHLDFENNLIHVPGTKSESSDRTIPMTQPARELFLRMRRERAGEDRDTKVFLVRECAKSLARACSTVGVPRMKHHTLRHYFATVAVRSRVDMPSVAAMLGHQDGGVLVMKTYAHVGGEHLRREAAKIAF